MALKVGAYAVTGSVGLLSDALESFVNLAGALLALAMLRVAAKPADEEHPYGHTKAEYFSSGVEGTLILLAAGSIVWVAVERLLAPRPLEQLRVGMALSVVAALLNLGVGLLLLRAAKAEASITLEASAHHLLTDVWTTAAVLVGVGVAAGTGWPRLDPLVALLVAAQIVRTGWDIVRRSVAGFMDAGLPPEEQAAVRRILDPYLASGVRFHALRTRQSGTRRFVSFHVLVPGAWTVQRGHDLLEAIEADVRAALPHVTVFTHLEALEDPASWDDTGLDRREPT
jgi:cation diffusion facilitator family transporter